MTNEGEFIWYDLMTTDPKGARAFYESVVGWSAVETPGQMPYTMWQAGGVGVGGMMQIAPELTAQGVPAHWMGYVQVADVDAKCAHVKELGGLIRRPPMDIGDAGRFAVVTDPQEAAFALFTPNPGMRFPASANDPGLFGWRELLTTDHRAGFRFYAELLGWAHTQSTDLGEGRGTYFAFRSAHGAADRSMGGMSDMAAAMQVHPHWTYCIQVADITAAVDAVQAGGGKLLHGPMEIAGGGSISHCDDPQGAGFALLQP